MFIHVLGLLLLFRYVSAVGGPSKPPRFNLGDSYNVDFSTDDDEGCKSQQDKIMTAWGEVLDHRAYQENGANCANNETILG